MPLQSGRIDAMWNRSYFAIRDANLVLESLESADFEADFEKK